MAHSARCRHRLVVFFPQIWTDAFESRCLLWQRRPWSLGGFQDSSGQNVVKMRVDTKLIAFSSSQVLDPKGALVSRVFKSLPLSVVAHSQPWLVAAVSDSSCSASVPRRGFVSGVQVQRSWPLRRGLALLHRLPGLGSRFWVDAAPYCATLLPGEPVHCTLRLNMFSA